ncbi:MAG TPA: sigma factor [Cellulomonas sp.]|nr:sigma factor [Cellulomonas sp.]
MARHQRDLLRTAWLLRGDAHRAEELAQQALVRTYAAWSRAGRGDPLAYARRVLVNLRVDTWRRRRRVLVDLPGAHARPGGLCRRADRRPRPAGPCSRDPDPASAADDRPATPP